MIRIELDMSEVQKRLDRYDRRFKTKKVFVESIIRPIVQREWKLNFLSEGRPAPGRNRWAELSDSRKKQRKLAGIGESHPILMGETGSLMEDVVTNPRITYRGDKVYISPTVSGKNVIKLKALHYGRPPSEIDAFGMIINKQQGVAKIGRGMGVLPTRPIIFVAIQAWREIVKRAKEYFFG